MEMRRRVLSRSDERIESLDGQSRAAKAQQRLRWGDQP